jgi:hypothetical protein
VQLPLPEKGHVLGCCRLLGITDICDWAALVKPRPQQEDHATPLPPLACPAAATDAVGLHNMT